MVRSLDWGIVGRRHGRRPNGAKALTTIGSPVMRGAAVGATENVIGGGLSRAAHGENHFDPRGMAGDVLLGGGAGRLARTSFRG